MNYILIVIILKVDFVFFIYQGHGKLIAKLIKVLKEQWNVYSLRIIEKENNNKEVNLKITSFCFIKIYFLIFRRCVFESWYVLSIDHKKHHFSNLCIIHHKYEILRLRAIYRRYKIYFLFDKLKIKFYN